MKNKHPHTETHMFAPWGLLVGNE